MSNPTTDARSDAMGTSTTASTTSTGAGEPLSAPADLDARPARDSRVEAVAHKSKFWSLLQQDLFGYAGDDPDPRPLPTRTLHSIKQKMTAYLQASVEERARSDSPTPWAWDALYLVFCSDRVKMPLGQVIPVPREDLWWLAATDDLVLLSDRVTHHYTTVDSVARPADRIFFIDEWPERFFLRAGLNAAGVAAELHPYIAGVLDQYLPPGLRGKKHVSISRAEFQRVIVGLVTLDTPELLDRYLEHRPQARQNFSVRFSMGMALMEAERDQLARWAVPHFSAALRAAAAGAEAKHAELAAARLYQALAIADFVQRYSASDPLAGKPFADTLRGLLAQHDEQVLSARLGVEDIARIGNAAGHAQRFAAAACYLDHAVAREPDHEGARHLRAMVRFRLPDWPGVVEDISAALAANACRTQARQDERAARDPRDRYGIGDDDALLGGLRRRRLEELNLLVNACVHLQRGPEARAAAEEMVAVDANKPDGHRILGALASQAGQIAEARRHFEAALALEKSARGKAALQQVLSSLPAAPAEDRADAQ
jgi:tetratricopeptide (TPR) repeat protein